MVLRLNSRSRLLMWLDIWHRCFGIVSGIFLETVVSLQLSGSVGRPFHAPIGTRQCKMGGRIIRLKLHRALEMCNGLCDATVVEFQISEFIV